MKWSYAYEITTKYVETHYCVLRTDLNWNGRSSSGRVGLNPWAVNRIRGNIVIGNKLSECDTGQ
jgi:hypothetical protein